MLRLEAFPLRLLLDVDLRAAGLREDVDFRAVPLLEREDDERLLAAVLLPDAFVERLRDDALLDLLLDPEDPLDVLVRCPPDFGFVAMLSPLSRTCAL